MKIQLIFLLSFLVMVACKPGEKVEVPGGLKNKLKTLYPKAEEIEWDQEEAGLEASFEVEDVDISVIFDSQGNIVETEQEIEKEALPEEVQTALQKDFPDYDIEEIAQILSKGITSFEAELENDSVKLNAIYTPAGKLIKKIVLSEEDEEKNSSNEVEDSDEEKQQESDEREQSIDQTALPEAVQSALTQRFAAYSIEEISMGSQEGQTVFETDLQKGDTKLIIFFNAEGKILDQMTPVQDNEESEETEPETASESEYE